MNNYALHRAEAMHDNNFRLTSRDMARIHRHQHPLVRSPFEGGGQVDQIQKRKQQGGARNTKFGRQSHATGLYTRPHPPFA